jgi:hypothetical protein
MKRLIINFMSGSLFLFLFTFSVNAQDTALKSLPAITVTPATKVPAAVNKSFNESFQNAQNPEWLKMNKNYLVTFITNDQKNRALYEKNGELIYHIHYGIEKNLPDDIRKLIKSNYLDYKIVMAISVNQDKRNIWVVNLEGEKDYIIVREEDEQLEEVGKMTKTM